jgi:hypothetical protein
MELTTKKSFPERQKELQALLQTRDGEAQLQTLASQYAHESGDHSWTGGSVITYILVYERVHGLISA